MRSVTRGGIASGAFHVVRHQRASFFPHGADGFMSGQCPGTGMVRMNAAGIASPCASCATSACHVPSSETTSARAVAAQMADAINGANAIAAHVAATASLLMSIAVFPFLFCQACRSRSIYANAVDSHRRASGSLLALGGHDAQAHSMRAVGEIIGQHVYVRVV